MTVALPAPPRHAGGGHLFADFADPTRTPRPIQSSCLLPTPLQPDMTEYFERDVMSPALKSPCPPTSSNNSAGPSSPGIDLRPFRIGPPPGIQRHPGVLRLSLQSGEVDIPPAFYVSRLEFKGEDMVAAEFWYERRSRDLLPAMPFCGGFIDPGRMGSEGSYYLDLPCDQNEWCQFRAAMRGDDPPTIPSKRAPFRARSVY